MGLIIVPVKRMNEGFRCELSWRMLWCGVVDGVWLALGGFFERCRRGSVCELGIVFSLLGREMELVRVWML